jgi:hypothetical protein
MEWTMNSVGHIVGIVPWLLFVVAVAWYAVRGLVADLREDRARTAPPELPTESRAERPAERRPAARAGRRVPATR